MTVEWILILGLGLALWAGWWWLGRRKRQTWRFLGEQLAEKPTESGRKPRASSSVLTGSGACWYGEQALYGVTVTVLDTHLRVTKGLLYSPLFIEWNSVTGLSIKKAPIFGDKRGKYLEARLTLVELNAPLTIPWRAEFRNVVPDTISVDDWTKRT